MDQEFERQDAERKWRGHCSPTEPNVTGNPRCLQPARIGCVTCCMRSSMEPAFVPVSTIPAAAPRREIVSMRWSASAATSQAPHGVERRRSSGPIACTTSCTAANASSTLVNSSMCVGRWVSRGTDRRTSLCCLCVATRWVRPGCGAGDFKLLSLRDSRCNRPIRRCRTWTHQGWPTRRRSPGDRAGRGWR